MKERTNLTWSSDGNMKERTNLTWSTDGNMKEWTKLTWSTAKERTKLTWSTVKEQTKLTWSTDGNMQKWTKLFFANNSPNMQNSGKILRHLKIGTKTHHQIQLSYHGILTVHNTPSLEFNCIYLEIGNW